MSFGDKNKDIDTGRADHLREWFKKIGEGLGLTTCIVFFYSMLLQPIDNSVTRFRKISKVCNSAKKSLLWGINSAEEIRNLGFNLIQLKRGKGNKLVLQR